MNPCNLPLEARPSLGAAFAEVRQPAASCRELPERDGVEIHHLRAGAAWWRGAGERRAMACGDILIRLPAGGEVIEAAGEEGVVIGVLFIPAAFRPGGLSPGRPRLLGRSALASECAAVMRWCALEAALGRPGWERCIAARAELLLIQLGRALSLPRQAAAPSVSGKARVLEYVRSLEKGVPALETLEAAAGRLGLSPRRFSALFREVAGTTWLKAVRSRQILEAKKMLAAWECPVGAVACRSGFEDETTFYRVFKRTTGTTPAQWRRRFRDGENARGGW